MKADNYLSMAISIMITLAFYILGGSILFALGLEPTDLACVEAISNIYTKIYGSWSYYLFMVGAFFVLYSTLCSHIVFFSRLLTDFFVNAEIIKEEKRGKWVRIFVPVRALPILLIVLLIGKPVTLVLFGGILASIITPVVFWSTIHLSKHYTDPNIAVGPFGRKMLIMLASIITIVTIFFIIYSYLG